MLRFGKTTWWVSTVCCIIAFISPLQDCNISPFKKSCEKSPVFHKSNLTLCHVGNVFMKMEPPPPCPRLHNGSEL